MTTTVTDYDRTNKATTTTRTKMAGTSITSERPSNDGSGAVATATNTAPETTAQTQQPAATTQPTAVSTSTEEQALQVLREYGFSRRLPPARSLGDSTI